MIGRFIRRFQDNPDGGLGGLTPAEDVELVKIQTEGADLAEALGMSDLVNGSDKLCECGDGWCGNPVHREEGSR